MHQWSSPPPLNSAICRHHRSKSGISERYPIADGFQWTFVITLDRGSGHCNETSPHSPWMERTTRRRSPPCSEATQIRARGRFGQGSDSRRWPFRKRLSSCSAGPIRAAVRPRSQQFVDAFRTAAINSSRSSAVSATRRPGQQVYAPGMILASMASRWARRRSPRAAIPLPTFHRRGRSRW